MTLSWNVNVDWAGTGSLTDERGRATRITTRRGRNTNYSSSGKTPMFMGEAWVELENYDNRYDPLYSFGPLYGDLIPGKFVQIVANDTGTSKPVFTGYIADIRPQGPGSQKAIMYLCDGSRWLSKQKCQTATAKPNCLVSTAMSDLLTQSAWPLVSSLDVFPLTFPIALGLQLVENNGDTIDSFTPPTSLSIWEALTDIAEAFLGTAYISAEGKFVYTTRSAVRYLPIGTLTADDLDNQIQQSMPWDQIWNDLQITPQSPGTLQTDSDAASAALYGQSTFALSGNLFIQSSTQATNMLSVLINYLPALKRGLKIRVLANSPVQFVPELVNSVKVTISELGIDNYYDFGAIEHSWVGGGECITTFTLEPNYHEVAGVQFFPLTFPITLVGGW